ncbi:MAG: metallophosphoesterase [Candidatus Eisenbacteria bacterium]|nr:metallophosphoesterase [Candidatus Eisenbacteria bacterium]
MADWLFTSDLHGQGDYYEQALALAESGRPRVLILGGDLGPHPSGAEGVRRHRLFLEGFLVEFARRLRERTPETALVLLMGNDDCASNHDVLDRHDGDLWHVLHERVLEFDGVRVAGSSFVPITPFRLKDWERWEDGGEESPPQLAGWVSEAGGAREFAFDPAARTPTIADSLAMLAGACDPAATLFVLHSPARGTKCDLVHGGHHVGSRAIRRFVEERRPRLVLSGHIHESPRVSGAWKDTLGETVLVNPGQFGSRHLAAVWFDPARPAETLRHTVMPATGTRDRTSF